MVQSNGDVFADGKLVERNESFALFDGAIIETAADFGTGNVIWTLMNNGTTPSGIPATAGVKASYKFSKLTSGDWYYTVLLASDA